MYNGAIKPVTNSCFCLYALGGESGELSLLVINPRLHVQTCPLHAEPRHFHGVWPLTHRSTITLMQKKTPTSDQYIYPDRESRKGVACEKYG